RNLPSDILHGAAIALPADVEPFRPDLLARLGREELRTDVQYPLACPDAAVHGIAHAQVLADALDVDRPILADEGSLPGDDPDARELRQVDGQTVGDAIGRLFVHPVAGPGKGQHRDWHAPV